MNRTSVNEVILQSISLLLHSKIIFLKGTDYFTLNYIFENLIPRSLIFQTMNSARLNSSGLKYHKSTTQDWRYKEIKKNLFKKNVDIFYHCCVFEQIY